MTENNRIEYKRELTEGLEKEVVAFLNSKDGGVIYLGLDNDGNSCGVENCDKVQLVIKDRLKNNIQPSIMGLFDIIHEEREMIHGRAMREAVINAVVHNDYANGASPKFEFFADRLEITSAGGLPHGVTEEDFFNGYSSPRNKEIMRVFRDLEMVEQLGSGVPRILEKYGRDAFELRPNFLRVIFYYDKPFAEHDAGPEPGTSSSRAQSGAQSASILSTLAKAPLSAAELTAALGLETKTGAFKRAIKELLEKQLIEYTLPGKPSSRLQKYRLSDQGRALLAPIKKGNNHAAK